MDYIEQLKAGNVRAVARLITLVERRDPGAMAAIREVYSQCGRSHMIGVTGPPGVGKSCLVTALVKSFRRHGRSVGVLAVDPSSPFSGGALLGDRARMMDLSGDPDVFIRSLASRGITGGLSAAVNDAADVLDVFGKEIVVIETVGVGQGEIDIARLAHTVLLVLMPGYGDTLQAMKAGVMEIADVMVVNKSDTPGAEKTVAELTSVQPDESAEQGRGQAWKVPIVKTAATNGDGVEDLAAVVQEHYEFLKRAGQLGSKNTQRRTRQFLDILSRRILDEFMEELKTDPALQKWVQKIGNLELDPYSASEEVIEMIREARDARRRS